MGIEPWQVKRNCEVCRVSRFRVLIGFDVHRDIPDRRPLFQQEMLYLRGNSMSLPNQQGTVDECMQVDKPAGAHTARAQTVDRADALHGFSQAGNDPDVLIGGSALG